MRGSYDPNAEVEEPLPPMTPFQTLCGVVAYRALLYVHLRTGERLGELGTKILRYGDRSTLRRFSKYTQVRVVRPGPSSEFH